MPRKARCPHCRPWFADCEGCEREIAIIRMEHWSERFKELAKLEPAKMQQELLGLVQINWRFTFSE